MRVNRNQGRTSKIATYGNFVTHYLLRRVYFFFTNPKKHAFKPLLTLTLHLTDGCWWKQ